MSQLQNLTDTSYLPLEIQLSETDLRTWKKELDDLDQSCWFYDSYRDVEMVCLYSGNGEYKTKELIYENRKKSLEWTEASVKTPLLSTFLKTKIEHLFDPMGRITIIKTEPSQSIKEHMDCSQAEAEEYHAKFRIVISGDVGGLYFLSENGRKHVPDTHHTYVIDGSRAHGMFNNSKEVKYTLCIGSPWLGKYTEEGNRLIKRSLEVNKKDIILRKDLGLNRSKVEYQN